MLPVNMKIDPIYEFARKVIFVTSTNYSLSYTNCDGEVVTSWYRSPEEVVYNLVTIRRYMPTPIHITKDDIICRSQIAILQYFTDNCVIITKDNIKKTYIMNAKSSVFAPTYTYDDNEIMGRRNAKKIYDRLYTNTPETIYVTEGFSIVTSCISDISRTENAIDITMRFEGINKNKRKMLFKDEEESLLAFNELERVLSFSN